MAETLLSFGVEKLRDLLIRESERFQGVGEQFGVLKSDVNMLRCFLEDAEAKKHTSAMVRNTVKEIKEIVYDAEDIIENFLLKEEMGKINGIKNMVNRFSQRMGLSFNITAISKRIAKVIRDMQSLGVQQVIVNEKHTHESIQERQREMRQTFSNDNETILVGFEINVRNLVSCLVEEDSSQVVSITGMGGIGKTTLARQVFNHETVRSHFAGLAWVCVSERLTRKYVWQTILRNLSPEFKDSMMSEEELQEKLIQVLERQKALIVLDDIWKEEDWDIIRPMFPRQKGWKVLLTSRNEGVALRADPNCFTFKPDFLSHEDSWTLFRKITFHKIDAEMEEMGKEMIKHCGGLPLAVKVLGGLLATKHTLSEWKRVFENIRSFIVGEASFNDRNISSVYNILYMSFEDLPAYLKHCFLYFAHFPEDFTIYVDKLAYYWAAEELPRPRYYDGMTIREVAHVYVEELVKRNMVSSERNRLTSRFETCHLHDMMREVCVLKAEEEIFLQTVHSTSTTNSKSLCISRRLAVELCNETYRLVGEMKNPKLRSILIINKQFSWIKWLASDLCFRRLQLMRVLDLSYAKFEGGKLPSSIGKLIHLRYLSLYHAKVSHLPSSMQNLKKLLYLNLDVSRGPPMYMPNFMKEMKELAYLWLPKKIQNNVMMELGNLVKLDTLENFSTKNSSVKDLHQMTMLRVLSIYISGEGCTMETLFSYLSGLRHLEHLKIDDDKADDYDYAVMNDEEGFVLNCIHLKQLWLSVYMPKLPDEQHFPSCLTTIFLIGCRLKEDPMPFLEKLLHLTEVTLSNKSFSGRRIVCSVGGFCQLQKLFLGGLLEWEEWKVEAGSMPLLHTLHIFHCYKLMEVPDGLQFITSLKKLELHTVDSGKEKEWKKRLSEGGEDYYKVQHIPIITIE